jgi:D-beta-D-heptose 7-phosphate kinase/D-beta-D-heptose 1-phosphate adenosyltransferase
MTQKYYLPLEIKQKLQKARDNNQVVVLVTGVFDLLHREHINFLEQAKAVGDVLLVGVETDERVRIIKSANRPINSEQERVEKLKQTGLPDAVFLLPESFNQEREHRAFLRTLEPDILAVSSHTPHLRQKKKLMEEIGGKLKVVYQQNPEISTSKILQEQQKHKGGSDQGSQHQSAVEGGQA